MTKRKAARLWALMSYREGERAPTLPRPAVALPSKGSA